MPRPGDKDRARAVQYGDVTRDVANRLDPHLPELNQTYAAEQLVMRLDHMIATLRASSVERDVIAVGGEAGTVGSRVPSSMSGTTSGTEPSALDHKSASHPDLCWLCSQSYLQSGPRLTILTLANGRLALVPAFSDFGRPARASCRCCLA
jgi:hypothetical protein